MSGNNSSGWNRPSSNQPTVKKGGAKAPSAMKGIIVGAIAVLIGVVCLWLFSGGEDAPKAKPEKGRGRIKAVKPATKAPAPPDSSTPTNSLSRVKGMLNDQVKEFVKKAVTNETEWLVKPLDPKDPDNALYTRTAKDIAGLLAIEPGEPVPKILPFGFMFGSSDDGGNARFVSELKKQKVVLKETDSESVAAHKEKLINAQLEILKGIDEGVSVDDSIRAAYDFRVRAAEARQSTIEMLAELHSKEDADVSITLETIKQMNKQLASEGIKTISPDEVIPDYEEPNDEAKAGDDTKTEEGEKSDEQ